MKTIQPVTGWANGKPIQANLLYAFVASDNLVNSAIFSYSMYSENSDQTIGQLFSGGQLTMMGADYIAYQTNQYAWDWIANQLNLTITGDYVPPTLAPDTSGTSGTSGTNATSGTSEI